MAKGLMTVVAKEIASPCAECGQTCKPTDFHPYLYCLLYKAGVPNQERYLRDSGFVRQTPPKKSPPFTSKQRSKARR